MVSKNVLAECWGLRQKMTVFLTVRRRRVARAQRMPLMKGCDDKLAKRVSAHAASCAKRKPLPS